MAKCGGCGKFMSSTASCVRCPKCSVDFHRACVKIPDNVKVTSTWVCPGCKSQIPKGDNSATPVKDLTSMSPPGDDQTRSAFSSTEFITPTDNLTQEIRAFREELQLTRSELKNELREVRQEITDFKIAIKSCTDRLDDMETRLAALEKKCGEVIVEPCAGTIQNTISELQVQLNERDQELLLNDVEIVGIPENKGETPLHIINLLSVKLGVDVDERDLVHAERIGPIHLNRIEGEGPPRPRPIVVRLARRCTRDHLLRAARVRRNITTAELGVAGAPRRIYVNERLTRQNRQLFYKAREEGRRHHYRYIWTRDGRIYLRKDDGQPAERIRTDRDLVKFFNKE